MGNIAFIFARGGSKGVPRKNIRIIAGKPLIAHSIELALESTMIDKVVVSTDDQEIARVAKSYGAEVPFLRPAELSTDEAPEWLAWQHACRYVLDNEVNKRFSTFISLPATSACKSLQDIETAVSSLDNTCDVVITGSLSNHHPAFNMVTTDDRGAGVRLLDQGVQISRRQDSPKVYNMATVAYVSRPEFILSANTLLAIWPVLLICV